MDRCVACQRRISRLIESIIREILSIIHSSVSIIESKVNLAVAVARSVSRRTKISNDDMF